MVQQILQEGKVDRFAGSEQSSLDAQTVESACAK
jgi:hypothetical protein